MKIIIFGYGYEGTRCYKELSNSIEYEVIGFADNSLYKQGNYVGSQPILSVDDLVRLNLTTEFAVIIAAGRWFEIGAQLERNNIRIIGIWKNDCLCKYERMTFEKLDLSKKITLYAGDIYDEEHLQNPNLYGLSINKADARHIFADITDKYPLPDNSIYSYQAEDVLEHIEIDKLVDTIDEIYRVLGEGGLFRICLPDYFSPYLKDISMKNKEGKILFDASGGGVYGENGVSAGGHVWFPNINNVRELLKKTKFVTCDFLCYHTEDGELIKKDIDFSKGYINRVPASDAADNVKYSIYSIVVDCYK